MIWDRVGMDKIAHFGVSAFLALAMSCFVPLWVSLPLALLAGVMKEVYDKRKKGLFDRKDLVADCLGVLAGGLVWALRMIIL